MSCSTSVSFPSAASHSLLALKRPFFEPPLTTFRMNTCRCVSKQMTLNPLYSALTQKRGEGVSRFLRPLSSPISAVPPVPGPPRSASSPKFNLPLSSPAPSLASHPFPCTLEIGASSPAQTVMPTRPGFRIVTIAGIPIYVHPTWLVIFVLITWTLVGQFSLEHPN